MSKDPKTLRARSEVTVDCRRVCNQLPDSRQAQSLLTTNNNGAPIRRQKITHFYPEPNKTSTNFVTNTEIEARNLLLQKQRVQVKERPQFNWQNMHRAQGMTDLSTIPENQNKKEDNRRNIPTSASGFEVFNSSGQQVDRHPAKTRGISLFSAPPTKTVSTPPTPTDSIDNYTYLDYVLTKMAASSKDDDDYANLWDSNSGSETSTYSANQQVMGSILRSKVHRKSSHDTNKRMAWLEHDDQFSQVEPREESDLVNLLTQQSPPFDMEKFESLKAKVDNMDLELTDFEHFGDLKHSISLLELSKMIRSTSSHSDCNLNVHEDCQSRLFDSCKGADVQLDKSTDNDVDDADSGYSGSGRSAGFTLTKEEILSRIQTYNESRRGSSCAMIVPMDGDDAFQGAIHVYINLEKPIHMTLKQRPTSIYDALDRTTELSPPTSPENTLSACTLPIDAPVSLHVKSTDRASNVVEILLKKFKITDHPKDFALYEQSIENEQEVKLRKIGDVELPLLNYLRWSTENLDSAKRFVLKEHNSADILWEAFSLPELNNFITMFQIEEQQAKQDIIGKYNLRRTQLQHRLSQIESEQKTAQ